MEMALDPFFTGFQQAVETNPFEAHEYGKASF